MGNLNFIRSNPTADAFNAQQDRSRRQEESDYQRQRQERADQAAAEQSTYQRQRDEQARADEMEKIAITALGSGDLGTFKHYAPKVGLEIPDEIVNDAEVRGLMARGMLTAEKFYKDSPDQAQRYVTSFLQSRGSPETAFQAAGVPRRRPNVSVEHIRQGDRDVVALLDKVSGKMTIPTDPGGQPYQVAPTGRGATPPADQRMIQYLVSIGVDQGEAVRLVTSAKQNPGAAAASIYGRVFAGSNELDAAKRHAEAAQAAEGFLARFFPGSRPAAPQPQQPPNVALGPGDLPPGTPVYDPSQSGAGRFQGSWPTGQR